MSLKWVIVDILDKLGQSVCNDIGPNTALYIHCDVTKETDVENAVNKAVAKFGKVDIMINSAVVIDEAKQSILENEVAKHKTYCPCYDPRASHAYTSSKHGIIGLTKNATVELGRYGIQVNCVSTYFIQTQAGKEFFKMEDTEANSIYSNLKDRHLELQDVADALLYLASDESKYESRQNLLVDGGFTIPNPAFGLFARSDI
ncbi:hypothetical protein Ancab_002535 [Ancistrocladus abbreviatus]